jgi:hypothetical protein
MRPRAASVTGDRGRLTGKKDPPRKLVGKKKSPPRIDLLRFQTGRPAHRIERKRASLRHPTRPIWDVSCRCGKWQLFDVLEADGDEAWREHVKKSNEHVEKSKRKKPRKMKKPKTT